MKNRIVWLSIMFSLAFAQVPNTISFQGYVTDAEGQELAAGSYYVEFGIYDAETEGSLYWTDSYWVAIAEGNGLISVLLGSDENPISLPEDGEAYLEISMQNEVVGSRSLITSVAYSMKSGAADTASYTINIPENYIQEIETLGQSTDSIFTLIESNIIDSIFVYDTLVVRDSLYIFTYDTTTVYDTTVVYDTLVVRDSLYIFTYDTVYLTYPELPPYPPTMINVSMSGDDILLSWSASVSENVSSYAIYKNNTYVISVDSSVTSYTTSDYSYNEEICFFVKAVSASGLQSNASMEACITTPENPDLLDIKLMSSVGESFKIYQNTTDSDNLIVDHPSQSGVFIFYDVLEAGEYIIWNGYCQCYNYSQQIDTDVIITTDGSDSPPPYYYTIEEWVQ
jgi:hypothetical protein